jgi:hypothetical protein
LAQQVKCQHGGTAVNVLVQSPEMCAMALKNENSVKIVFILNVIERQLHGIYIYLTAINYCNRFVQGVHRQRLYKHGDYATVESGVSFELSSAVLCQAAPRFALPRKSYPTTVRN